MGKNRVNPLLKLSRCGSWCFSSLPERLPLNNFHEFQGAISVLAHFSRAEDMIPECLQAQVQEKLNLSDDVEAADAREIFVQRLLQRLVLENKERPGRAFFQGLKWDWRIGIWTEEVGEWDMTLHWKVTWWSYVFFGG